MLTKTVDKTIVFHARYTLHNVWPQRTNLFSFLGGNTIGMQVMQRPVNQGLTSSFEEQLHFIS